MTRDHFLSVLSSDSILLPLLSLFWVLHFSYLFFSVCGLSCVLTSLRLVGDLKKSFEENLFPQV